MRQSNRVPRIVIHCGLLLSVGCNPGKEDRGVSGSSGTSWPVAPGGAGAELTPASSASLTDSARVSQENSLSRLKPSLAVSELTAQSRTVWSRCYQGFSASGDSTRDAQRLATLCGPVTGMQPVGPRYRGSLAEGEASTVNIELEGECVRIVAAAAGSVEDLEVELLVPRGGASLALVNLGQPWAVLPRDKPVCAPHPGVFGVRLSSHAGEGTFEFRVLKYWPTGNRPK